jgi:hypothetical protein
MTFPVESTALIPSEYEYRAITLVVLLDNIFMTAKETGSRRHTCVQIQVPRLWQFMVFSNHGEDDCRPASKLPLTDT